VADSIFSTTSFLFKTYGAFWDIRIGCHMTISKKECSVEAIIVLWD